MSIANQIQLPSHTFISKFFSVTVCWRVLTILSIIFLNSNTIFSQTTFIVTSTGDGVESKMHSID